MMHGFGEFYWPHVKYTGMYCKNKKQGPGCFTYSDGSTLRVTYEESQPVDCVHQVGQCILDNKEDQSIYVFEMVGGLLDKKTIRRSSASSASHVESWLSMAPEKQHSTITLLASLLEELPSEKEPDERRFQSMNLLTYHEF